LNFRPRTRRDLASFDRDRDRGLHSGAYAMHVRFPREMHSTYVVRWAARSPAPADPHQMTDSRAARGVWSAAFGAPWLDRGGRFSSLKAGALAGMLLPGVVTAWHWISGDLGVQPVTAAIDDTGLWTIWFVLITLAISPLRRRADWPKVTLLRRMVGLTAMAYAVAHLTLFVLDQKFQLTIVVREIALRIYLTIGFVTLLGVCILGLTSTDGWMRKLGGNWVRLHRMIFGLGVLGILHFFMQSKANVSEAAIMAGFFLWLGLWRVFPARYRGNFLALLALTVLSVAGTACLEFAWYAVATNVPAMRVFKANLSFSFGFRPAMWVGLTALAVASLVGTRQLLITIIPRARA
jgi:sulfoxide reductase heme-binding subunit YedZ